MNATMHSSYPQNLSVIDVHCHITDTPQNLNDISELTTNKVALMGTRLNDWDIVLQTHLKYPKKTLAGLGIHPWHACMTIQLDPNWLKTLESNIAQNKNLFIGEIGVDKAAKDPLTNHLYDWDTQLTVFQSQWDLAVQLNRPVSMHCVHAQGWCLDFFRMQAMKYKKKSDITQHHIYPPSIMLHSFNGSKELIKQLVQLKGIGPRLYFSYSILVSSHSSQFASRVQATPTNRLLLESDTHDSALVDSAMHEVLFAVSIILGWTPDQTAKVTTDNALQFFNCLN